MTKIEFLVPLRGDLSDGPLIERTCGLAQLLNGQVVAILAQISAAEMMAWPIDGSFATASASMFEAAQTGNDEAWSRHQNFVLEMAKAYPELTIERVIGHPETLLGKRAALSDVAVFSCESARGKTGVSRVFTSLLMDARSPVMVLRGTAAPKFDRVALAWDGSLEASRAAKAALVFLKAAREIVIMQTAEVSDFKATDVPLDHPLRLQEWLARHDIAASIQPIHTTTDAAADVLTTCAALGIDLLVCGAYGHSRAQEFIFGGMTRTLINTTTSPALFLCH